MNNETVNYAYLCGLLEAKIVDLAYDQKFLTIPKNDYEARRQYLKNLIVEAEKMAVNFEKKYNKL